MRSFKVLVVKKVKHFQSKAGKQLVFKFFSKFIDAQTESLIIFSPDFFKKQIVKRQKCDWLGCRIQEQKAWGSILGIGHGNSTLGQGYFTPMCGPIHPGVYIHVYG